MTWQPPGWDDFIGGFGQPYGLQFALPGELAKQDIQPIPPPPPPPPPQQQLDQGLPSYAETAAAPDNVEAPPLAPPVIDQAHADAVSGGFTDDQQNSLAAAHLTPDLLTPPPIEQPQFSYNPGGLQIASDLPEDYLSNSELGDKYAALPVDEQEKKRLEVEGARDQFHGAKLIEASTNAMRAAEENARIYHDSVKQSQERAVQADDEAKKIAETNPLDTISGGRKVLGVLASIVGGFMMNKTGRNVGLETVDKMIDQASSDLAIKLHDAQNRGRNAREGVAQAGDLFHTQETVRLAMYDQTIRQAETEAQQFDPRGTQALRYMDTANQLKARRAAALQAYASEQQKRIESAQKQTLEAYKTEGQYAKDMADVEKTQAETAKLKGQLGGGAAKVIKFEDQPMSLSQLRGYGVEIPDGVTEPPGGMSISQAKKLSEAGTSAQAWNKSVLDSNMRNIGGIPSVEIDKDGNPKVDFNGNPVIKYEDLKNDDGKAFKAPSDPEATEFRKKTAAVNTIQTLMGQTIMLRKKYNWSSDLLQSPEWQKMKANWSTILVKQKDLQALGAISESDLKLIGGLMGAKDPTQFRDPLDGMVQAFDNTELQYNTDLRALRYTGKDIHFARPWTRPGVEATPEQKSVEEITAFDPERSLTAKDYQDLGVDWTAPKNRGGGAVTATKVALDREGGVPPRIKQQIDALRAAQQDPDPKKREFAVQALKNISDGALDPNVKAYASANAFDPASIVSPKLSKEEVR